MRILIVRNIFRDCSAEVIFSSPAWCRGRSRPPWPRGRACRQRSSSRRAARTARGHTRAQHSHSAQANEKIESEIHKKCKEVSPGGRVTRTAPSPCTRSCPSARAEYFARESIVDGKINVLSRYFFSNDRQNIPPWPQLVRALGDPALALAVRDNLLMN